ncbi:hypothetical protein KDL45_09495 [bacterium]|nr:hypothetical protein [bacterium]
MRLWWMTAALALTTAALVVGISCDSSSDEEETRSFGDDDDDTGTGAPPPSPATSVLDVPGAEYVEGARPTAADESGTPTISDMAFPKTVINGGSARYTFNADDPDGRDDIEDVLIAVQGFDGYFVLPADVAEDGETKADIFIKDSVDFSPMTVCVMVRDSADLISEDICNEHIVEITGTGDIKVSLTFDASEDLDLYVVEPSGETINFSHRDSSSGGSLDLDSNPACFIDGVNNENVFWDFGEAPTGEYQVLVDYFENCSAPEVNYFVNVLIGEELLSFEGTFVPADVDNLEPTLITTFTFP